MTSKQREEMAAAVARIDERTQNIQTDVADIKSELAAQTDLTAATNIRVAVVEEQIKTGDKGRKRIWTLLGGLGLTVGGAIAERLDWIPWL